MAKMNVTPLLAMVLMLGTGSAVWAQEATGEAAEAGTTTETAVTPPAEGEATTAAETATEDPANTFPTGQADPNGPGSWTHPDLSRMVYADGKVITPLFRARPGDQRLDRATGELTPARAEPDAGLHFEGTGEAAWGTKWVIVAVRSEEVHGRIILDTDWVPSPGGEAATAMGCFRSLAPRIPGAQGVIYDAALRGVHHQALLRELGLLPVNRVTAAKASDKKPRRAEGQRGLAVPE